MDTPLTNQLNYSEPVKSTIANASIANASIANASIPEIGISSDLIKLPEENQNLFRGLLRREIDLAFSSKYIKEKQVSDIRNYYRVEKPQAGRNVVQEDGNSKFIIDEDLPAYTIPIIRSKIRGLDAALTRQLHRSPLMVGRAQTEKDREAEPAMEFYLEQILNKTGSTYMLIASLKEACLTPCPYMTIEMIDGLPHLRLIRYENWAVSPIDTVDLKYSNLFLKGNQPIYLLKEYAAKGIYDNEMVSKVKPNATSRRETAPQETDEYGIAFDSYSDIQPVDIYECYYRFKGILYHVYYAYESDVILRCVPNEYKNVCGDYPPGHPIRTEITHDMIYGILYPAAVIPFQEIMDATFNSAEAYKRFVNNPPVFADKNSEFYKRFGEAGEVIDPGRIYPTNGDPKQNIYIPTFPDIPTQTQHLAYIKQFVDMASTQDLSATGLPLQGIRSAKEVGVIDEASSALMGNIIMTVALDWSKIIGQYWMFIYHYIIKPQGVVEIGEGDTQYLLASQDIDTEQLREYFIEFAGTVGFDPQYAELASQNLNKTVLSANRPEIQWLPNGIQLVADKMEKAQRVLQALNMSGYFNMAYQFAPIYYLLKSFLELAEIPYASKMLPPVAPTNTQAPPEAFQFLSEMTSKLRQGGATGVVQ